MLPTRSAAVRRSALPVLAALALALAMGFINLDGYLMNNDEETYLYGAWRVSLGEVPYADFMVVQTPLGFYLAGALFKVFGPSVWWARALSYLLVLGAAVFVAAAARSIFRFGPLVSLACGVVFLFSKHVYFLGRSFMPDSAMLFFAAGAVYFALRGEAGQVGDAAPPGRRGLSAFLFGVFAGLAALAKLNAVLLVTAYGLYAAVLWIGRKERFPDVARRCLAAGAGFLTTFGLVYGLMLLFVPGTFQATLGVHAAKAKFALADLLLLWGERIAEFIGNHNYGIIAVAAAGMVFRPVFRERKRTFLVFVVLAVLAQILMPVTFYLRYAIMALIPLALFFGDGLEGLASMKKGWKKIPVSAAAGLLVLLGLLPSFSPKKLLAVEKSTREIADFVRSRTAPNDYVFGETPFANFYARRPCPPALVDVSMARTKSGQVRPADVKRECDRFKVKMIVVERGGAAHNLTNLRPYSEFQEYLDARYDLVKSMRREFLDVDIYQRKPGI